MTTVVQESSFDEFPAGNSTQFQEVMSDSTDSATSLTHQDDSSHVYTNIQEIEELNSRPVPPTPKPGEQSKRDLCNGWFEYETDVGRTYFHNRATGKSQWIPPRFIRTPAQVQEFLRATRSNIDETCTFEGTSAEEHKENQIEEASERKSQLIEDEEVFDEVCDEPEERPLPIPIDYGSEDSEFCSDSEPDESDPIATASSVMPHPYVPMSTFQSVPAPPRDPRDDPNPIRVRRPSPASLRSVSFQNKCTVLKNVPMPQVLPTTSASFDHTHTPDRPSIESLEERNSERRGSSESREPVRTIKCGDLERSEKEEAVGGVKPRKREWVTNWMYLTSAHLILYKDQKSAEKHGKHYDAPQGVWDLRGARVSWFQDEKDAKQKKQRKYVQLELCNTKKYLLRGGADTEVVDWYKSLEEVVAKLPAPGASSVIDVTTSVARNPSYLGSTRPLSHALIPISRSMRRRDDPMSQSAIETVSSTSTAIDESKPSKETIIEKLRRFFRTRPTVESLKEKGIYKPEPVFGSTLAAICQHENSLVPKFIRVITEVIESKGIETDGIYRVSGNLSAVQKIRCQADQDNYKALVAEEDIHVLTGALKLFFRELTEPLFPISLHKEYTSAMQMPNATARFKKFEELLGRLPNENRETLKSVLRHLNRVASHSSQNRMQLHNLAIVFGPTLFHNGDGAASVPAKNKKGAKKTKANKKDDQPAPIQSNSHLAFAMIIQSQIVQYLLESANKFDILKAPVNIGR